MRAAIPDRHQQIDHEILKEVRRTLLEAFKQPGCECAPQVLVADFERFFWCFRLGLAGAFLGFGPSRCTHKFNEFREPPQEFCINALRAVLEDIQATSRDSKFPASRTFQKPRLSQVRSRPANAVIEDRLPAARPQFSPFFRGELELHSKLFNGLWKQVVLLVIGKFKQRPHYTLIIRNRHGSDFSFYEFYASKAISFCTHMQGITRPTPRYEMRAEERTPRFTSPRKLSG